MTMPTPPSVPRRSLRRLLVAIIAACLLPILLGLGAVLVALRYGEAERERLAILASTQRLADLVERELDGYIAALQGLATSQAISRADWVTFDAQARALAAQRGSAVALRRLDGQQLVNTYAPLGTPLPVSNDPVLRAADHRAAATGRPVVSDLYIGAVARRQFVLAVVPVSVDGEVRYMLNVAVLPERLSALIARATPPDHISIVFDTSNRIIARSRDVDQHLGRAAGRAASAAMATPDGVWWQRASDGTSVLAAHVALPSGWHVATFVPAKLLPGSTTPALAALALLGLGTIPLVFAIAWRGARRLAAEVRLLTDPKLRSSSEANFRLAEFYDLARELNGHDRARSAALRTQAHLAAVVEGSNDAIFTTDPDGTVLAWNRGAEALFGYSSTEIVGSNVRRLVPPDRSEEVATKMAHVLQGRPFRIDTVRMRKDNTLVEVAISAAPLAPADTAADPAISVVAYEITERKAAERQREVLLRELDHRLKNVFATISSLIGISARSASDVPTYAAALRARIYALSAVHNLVRGTDLDDAASLAAIAQTITTSCADQIEAHGPEVRLPATAAIALGMILNELLTNALKYGALSCPEGRVRIAWTRGRTLRLEWRETGGPKPKPPTRRGFGSLMIEQNVQAIGGTMKADWTAAGLVATIDWCAGSARHEGCAA